jgi:hypothetical protein
MATSNEPKRDNEPPNTRCNISVRPRIADVLPTCSLGDRIIAVLRIDAQRPDNQERVIRGFIIAVNNHATRNLVGP